jgi:D-alanine transaminase
MPELAYVNGKIMPIEQAYVPIEDRGYQFGDAVYEFFASYHGHIFAMEAHLDRLERSLNALAFAPIDRGSIKDAVEKTFQQAGYDRAGIYLQISRGVGPRNHAFPLNAKPQIIITVRPVPEVAEPLLGMGAKAITVTDIRWGRCDIKTVQLLPNAWAKQQAIDAGADDAIFVTEDSVVREGSASNVFIASNSTLMTHPLTSNILPGITRAHVIDICNARRIAVREEFFDQSAMLAADEVFLTGTVAEVLPITIVDDQPIGDGKPGPLATKLFGWLRESTGG